MNKFNENDWKRYKASGGTFTKEHFRALNMAEKRRKQKERAGDKNPFDLSIRF